MTMDIFNVLIDPTTCVYIYHMYVSSFSTDTFDFVHQLCVCVCVAFTIRLVLTDDS